MNNKIVASLVGVIALLSVGIAYLGYNLNEQKQVNKDMQELAALDKKEIREQQRTQELLEELRRTKATDAAEITRLKKELATVRAILRSYVLQIDSLNQVNTELMNENNRVRSELAESNQQNMQLTSSNASLSEKVAIASQLNAANINVIMLDKKGKEQTSCQWYAHRLLPCYQSFRRGHQRWRHLSVGRLSGCLHSQAGCGLHWSGEVDGDVCSKDVSDRRKIYYSGNC